MEARELKEFAVAVAAAEGREVRCWYGYRDFLLGEMNGGWVFASAVADDGAPFAIAEEGQLLVWPGLEAARRAIDRLWRVH